MLPNSGDLCFLDILQTGAPFSSLDSADETSFNENSLLSFSASSGVLRLVNCRIFFSKHLELVVLLHVSVVSSNGRLPRSLTQACLIKITEQETKTFYERNTTRGDKSEPLQS
jgi:hypothetical protein